MRSSRLFGTNCPKVSGNGDRIRGIMLLKTNLGAPVVQIGQLRVWLAPISASCGLQLGPNISTPELPSGRVGLFLLSGSCSARLRNILDERRLIFPFSWCGPREPVAGIRANRNYAWLQGTAFRFSQLAVLNSNLSRREALGQATRREGFVQIRGPASPRKSSPFG